MGKNVHDTFYRRFCFFFDLAIMDIAQLHELVRDFYGGIESYLLKKTL